MNERLLHEFRERAELLVRLPDLYELQRRGAQRRRLRIAAIAACVVSALAIAAAVVTSSVSDENAVPPARGGTPTEVATGFLVSYGEFDADQAISYLSEDAVVDGWGSAEQFRQQIAHLEAIGYRQAINGCDVRGYGGDVSCAVDFHALGSEFGFDAYDNNYWDFTVRDGKIITADSNLALMSYPFSTQMWEPFENWVTVHHANDARIMYTNFGHFTPRLTAESNRLWRQHRLEYTEVADSWTTSMGPPDLVAYQSQLDSVCRAAQVRLLDEVQAAGVELGHGRNIRGLGLGIPGRIGGEDFTTYEDAARRIMGETLPALRGIRAPEIVRSSPYQRQPFPAMQQFADGTEAPFTPTPEFWIHQVDNHAGLHHCTFGLPA